ncbi:alpha/beta hydrolase domain-containing protein [Nocardioides alpinus]|uniref:alpha/beta hydrolase domain-containing protein n=1 Tax=Nocardioides alpinus TaxID=748909 RepID=UPI0011139328|nr:alpha/beta hydrolase domain-containing protein [Nocardioides alpinus]
MSAEVAWTSSSTPFSADGVFAEWPMPAGYTEKEYFISGTASIYEYSDTGVRVVSPCPASVTGDARPSCSGLPYTTRILIAMPKQPRDFSGNVWVNPLNPSAGYDMRVDWNRTQRYHVRKGNAYVMWTAASWAVDALKQHDPQRYSALHWPSDPRRVGTPYDGIAYDVAAQLGRLLKENTPDSPLHRYDVERVFEAGFSYDGGLTFTQANIFHNLLRMPGGGGIYDGYLPQGSWAQDMVPLNPWPTGYLPEGDPRLRMGSRDAPVIKVNTETELALPIPISWRRPDSDAPHDRYRGWEVPGASHDDQQTLSDPSNMALFGTVSFPSECAHKDPPHVSPTDFRYGYVANAAADALVNWVTTGSSPPHASHIEQTDLSNPSKQTIMRDRFGNARGGVRTPQLTVPRSAFHVIDDGPAFCWSIGWSTPLSNSVLTSLYTSSADYKRQFAAAAKQTVELGFWLEADAREAIRELATLP